LSIKSQRGMSSPIYEMAGIAYRLNVCGLYRDVREWLL